MIYLTACVACLTAGCKSYYAKTLVFNTKYEQRDYAGAMQYLDSEEKLQRSNNKVLYDLNYGTAAFMAEDSKTSIEHFSEADKYDEDFTKNYAYEALALISNPMVRPYQMEYYESVLLHFYQAMNYVRQNDYEGALVECRRMNLSLQRQDDAFKKHDGKRYSRDAFGHLLMGLVYEAAGDNNNAFVAYRNSYEIYKDDYVGMYNVEVPSTLKAAIIRTAYKTGLMSEGVQFEKEFEMTYVKSSKDSGRLVMLVLDGLGPIKTEKVLEFVKVPSAGMVTYYCSELGWTIPVYYDDLSGSDKSAIDDFSMMRIALPQMESRASSCQQVQVLIDSSMHMPTVVEDVDQIAKQSLRDRHWAELGKAVLRAATKAAASKVAREKNEYVGLLVNLAGAIAEKADTRGWMSLPARIELIDVELPAGEHKIEYKTCDGTTTASVTIVAGKSSFLTFRGR